MIFGANKWYVIGGAIVAVIVALLTAYWLGTHVGNVTGKAVCETTHATTQLDTNKKAKVNYDKIDRNTPRASNKPASVKWLYDNASNRQ